MLICTWCASASSHGARWSHQKAVTTWIGSRARSGSRKSTTSRSSSARPRTRRRHGSPRRILKPCASTPTGRPAEHGSRRQFNYASPEYRKFCAAIAEQLARRFGHDPDVIGWQIGNEYTEESFDPATRRQFEEWLKRKYGTLDALNRAWVTAYWSQTYDRWEEIPLPTAGGNPGLLLDHRRFVSDTWRDFQQVQIDVDSQVRRSAPVHHHQHRRPGLVATTGTTTRSRARSISPHGTTTWAKGI